MAPIAPPVCHEPAVSGQWWMGSRRRKLKRLDSLRARPYRIYRQHTLLSPQQSALMQHLPVVDAPTSRRRGERKRVSAAARRWRVVVYHLAIHDADHFASEPCFQKKSHEQQVIRPSHGRPRAHINAGISVCRHRSLPVQPRRLLSYDPIYLAPCARARLRCDSLPKGLLCAALPRSFAAVQHQRSVK